MLIQFEGVYFNPEKVNFIRITSENEILLSFNCGYLKFKGTENCQKLVDLINNA